MWSEIGFKNNIFFVEPLDISEKGAELFIGRKNELDEFIADIIGEIRCLKILTGDIGCGKTSFINVCQYYFLNQELNSLKSNNILILPSYRSIEIDEYDDLTAVLTKINYTLAANIEKYYETVGKNIPSSLKEYINYWSNFKIHTGGNQFNINATIIGSGGGFGRQKQSFSIIEIKDLLKSIVEVKTGFLKDNALDGIFLVIDNLDLLSKQRLVKLINEARDSLFNIDYIFWILIGDLDTGKIIKNYNKRVVSYINGNIMKLGKLKYEYFLSIIQERAKFFRLSEDRLSDILEYRKRMLKERERSMVVKPATIPLSENIIKMIYGFAHNELRESFRICSAIIKRGYQRVIQYGFIPDPLAYNLFYEFCESEVSDEDLTQQDKNLLSKIYRKESVINGDYKIFGYSTAQGFNSLLRSYENRNLLSPTVINSQVAFIPTWKLEALAICNHLSSDCTENSLSKYASNIF